MGQLSLFIMQLLTILEIILYFWDLEELNTICALISKISLSSRNSCHGAYKLDALLQPDRNQGSGT